MKTPRVTYNRRDLDIAILNNQEKIGGTSGAAKDDTFDYFIIDVFGANPVTLKDKDSNVKLIVNGDIDLHNPLRFDGGFEFTCSTTAYVVYCILAKNQGV